MLNQMDQIYETGLKASETVGMYANVILFFIYNLSSVVPNIIGLHLQYWFCTKSLEKRNKVPCE